MSNRSHRSRNDSFLVEGLSWAALVQRLWYACADLWLMDGKKKPRAEARRLEGLLFLVIIYSFLCIIVTIVCSRRPVQRVTLRDSSIK